VRISGYCDYREGFVEVSTSKAIERADRRAKASMPILRVSGYRVYQEGLPMGGGALPVRGAPRYPADFETCSCLTAKPAHMFRVTLRVTFKFLEET
jgi:hypothetical protein